MKLQGSHKFIAIVLGLILLVWAGWKGYAAIRLSGVEITPVEPGQVNIVAVSPKAGYKIIVANQIAYLAKVEGDLEVGAMDPSGDDVAGASRLPLRELLETLQGKEDSVGVLVMRLNDWEETDLRAKTWKAEDIKKVLDGDKDLEAKLVKDLNVGLDGVPSDTIDIDRIYEGIVIDSPVTLEFKTGDTTRKMVGRVQQAYQPMFSARIEMRLREKFNAPTEVVTGIYLEEAQAVMEAGSTENVRNSLASRIDPNRLAQLAEKPRLVLENTTVLLNEGHIVSAAYKNYDTGRGKTTNDLTIGLSEEGRMRLWKYSHDNQGFQLLFIVDTIAIAAPRITTELAESNITIRQVPSEDLVKNAVNLLNDIIKDKK